jgi:hypothetical protein
MSIIDIDEAYASLSDPNFQGPLYVIYTRPEVITSLWTIPNIIPSYNSEHDPIDPVTYVPQSQPEHVQVRPVKVEIVIPFHDDSIVLQEGNPPIDLMQQKSRLEILFSPEIRELALDQRLQFLNTEFAEQILALPENTALLKEREEQKAYFAKRFYHGQPESDLHTFTDQLDYLLSGETKTRYGHYLDMTLYWTPRK